MFYVKLFYGGGLLNTRKEINSKEVGIRIRNIRQSHGLSQSSFGDKVGDAHKSLVSKWERGENLPNNERIKIIAELGHVSVEYLLYGEEDDTSNMSLKKYLNYKLDEHIQETFPQNSVINNLLLNSKLISSESNHSKDTKQHADTIKKIGQKYIDEMYYSDITLETLQAVSSSLTIENFIQYRENAWYEFKNFLDKKVFELRFNSERDVLYLIKTLFIDKFEYKFLEALEQFDDPDELNQFIFEEIEPLLTEASQKIITVSDDVIN